MANYIPEGVNVILQSENGFVGLGQAPEAELILDDELKTMEVLQK